MAALGGGSRRLSGPETGANLIIYHLEADERLATGAAHLTGGRFELFGFRRAGSSSTRPVGRPGRGLIARPMADHGPGELREQVVVGPADRVPNGARAQVTQTPIKCSGAQLNPILPAPELLTWPTIRSEVASAPAISDVRPADGLSDRLCVA